MSIVRLIVAIVVGSSSFVVACSSEDQGGGTAENKQDVSATQAASQTAGLPDCCGGRAKCVPKSRVSEDRLENLAACEGGSGSAATDVCVPLPFINNSNFKGGACKGQVNISETSKIPYDGVCLSDCLNIPSKDLLSRDGCATGDLCVPCLHPVTGAPTGAPGCE